MQARAGNPANTNKNQWRATAPDSVLERNLERDLRHAHELRRFALHYQPIVEMKTRRIASAEALLRWNDPERGLVPPATFVPLLESTGLIVQIGKWAAREAAAACRRWREAGCAPIRIGVNVSPSQLRRPELVETFLEIASELDDCGYGLDIELTDGMFEDPQCLARLRSAGVRIALDDLGAGYCSLARFSTLPVDILKIDRSFTSRVVDHPRAADVVSMVVGLARRFGAATVATGVETHSQFERLREIGCDYSQGFLHSQPLPAADLEPLLRHDSDALAAGQKLADDTETLLDSLIACIGYVTPGARTLRSPAALPPKLRPIALATPGNASWRAWNLDERTRFVQAQVCSEVAEKLKRPALLACFYDMEGRRVGAGVWTRGRDGRWRLYDVMAAALPDAAANGAAPATDG